MDKQADLLFGILALEMNFITKEHLVECAALWMAQGSGHGAKSAEHRGKSREHRAESVEQGEEPSRDREGAASRGGAPVASCGSDYARESGDRQNASPPRPSAARQSKIQNLKSKIGRGLPDILSEKRYIKPFQREAVEHLVEAQLATCNNDPRKSIAAIGIERGLKDELLRTIRAAKQPGLSAGQSGALEKEITQLGESIVKAKDIAAPSTIILTRPPEKKYTIKEEIGKGGLGRVMLAIDNDVGRPVAIKFVRGDIPTEHIERFQRESFITGRLEHPNIVPVHDIGAMEEVAQASSLPPSGDSGAHDRTPPHLLGAGRPSTAQLYMAMKLVKGRDLGQVIRSVAAGNPDDANKWTTRRLVETFKDVCMALAFAHSRGVVHRDLKPSNVMVGEFGETLVVDWGLAKVRGETDIHEQSFALRAASLSGSYSPLAGSDTPQLTMEGTVMGTPQYMPPEQALGHVHEIDERSDVYSLGALLYELLTLHPPFEGKTALEVLRKVIAGDLIPPNSRVESDAGALAETVQQAADEACRRTLEQGIRESGDQGIRKSGDQEIRKSGDQGRQGKPSRDHEGAASCGGAPAASGGSEYARKCDDRQDASPSHPSAARRATIVNRQSQIENRKIPPELETICLKCLARRKEDRFQSVEKLAEEIGLFLEGAKERERLRELAERCAQEGRNFSKAYFDLKEKLTEAKKKAKKAAEKIKGHEPIEEQMPVWRLQDVAEATENTRIRAFGDAANKFMEGVGFQARNENVRKGLCELYWDRFCEADKNDNNADMTYYRGLVMTYGREWYEKKLKGDGTLSVRTQVCPCNCLNQESAIRNLRSKIEIRFHPDDMVECSWGSKQLREEDKCLVPRISIEHGTESKEHGAKNAEEQSRDREGAANLKSRIQNLKSVPGHSADCRPSPLSGALAWLFRFKEKGRILLPSFPDDVDCSAGILPASADEIRKVQEIVEANPYVHNVSTPPRQQIAAVNGQMSMVKGQMSIVNCSSAGETPALRLSDGLFIGVTPIEKLKLPMGSYLLVIRGPYEPTTDNGERQQPSNHSTISTSAAQSSWAGNRTWNRP